MAISYPITLPTSPTLRDITIRARSVVGTRASQFTLQPQSYVWGGQIISALCRLPPMPSRADAEAWVAALVSLNGMEGSFLLGDTANTTPRGTATGTPLVKGAGQTGRTLITDGWTAGVTGIVKAGDWFQLGSGSTARLHKIMVDANSNGSGEATLDIWPALRSSPADNAALTVSSPKGRFMLASNETEWSIDEARVYGLSFEAVEDLRP
jgi:hypothetical protein